MALADYIVTKPIIETARLKIRSMCADDIPALKEWMPDPTLYTYWGKGPSKAEKNPELLFEKSEKPTKSFHLGIEEIETIKIVGDLYVYLIAHAAHFQSLQIVGSLNRAFVVGHIPDTVKVISKI